MAIEAPRDFVSIIHRIYIFSLYNYAYGTIIYISIGIGTNGTGIGSATKDLLYLLYLYLFSILSSLCYDWDLGIMHDSYLQLMQDDDGN